MDTSDFNPAELALFQGLLSDRRYVLGETVPDEDPDATGSVTVRGEILSRILRCSELLESDNAMMMIFGARIEGLTSEGLELDSPLVFVGCRFIGGVCFAAAKLSALTFIDCDMGDLGVSAAEVSQDLWLENCRVRGRIDFSGVAIRGSLKLQHTEIKPTDPEPFYVLDCSYCRVGQDILIPGPSKINGGLNFRGCEVGGRLIMSGAEIRIDSRYLPDWAHAQEQASPSTLVLERSSLRGGLYCDDGFECSGPISLAHAYVGGGVSFRHAALLTRGGPTLSAEYLKTEGDLLLDGEFLSSGEVQLAGAHIGGVLFLGGFALGNSVSYLMFNVTVFPGGRDRACILDLRRASLGGLSSASLDRVVARISGLDVRKLVPPPSGSDTTTLLSLLDSDPDGFVGGSYSWIARELRSSGYDAAARTVAYKAELRRRAQSPRLVRFAWNPALRAVMGFGYRPWRPMYWIAALMIVGYLVVASLSAAPPFAWLPSSDTSQFVPTSATSPPFNALLYAGSALLPVVDLGFSGWAPATATAQAVTAVLGVCGWGLLFVVLAGASSVLRRRTE